MNTAHSIVQDIKVKSMEWYKHSIRVKYYTEVLAKERKLSQNIIRILGFAALLHDIDKIKLLEHKNYEMSRLPYAEPYMHNGNNIIEKKVFSPLTFFEELISPASQHNISLTYTEYISAKDIQVASRILVLADAIEAFTGDLSSHEIISMKNAYCMIAKYAKIHYEIEICNAFLGNADKYSDISDC